MILVLAGLIFISMLLEGALTTLPLTLICLLCFTIIKRDTSVLPLAFATGFFLDIFRVQSIGTTSLFFICFLFLVLLYQKKYEIYSAPFAMISALLGSAVYLWVFGHKEIVPLAIVSSAVATILFAIIRYLTESHEHKQKTKFLTI